MENLYFSKISDAGIIPKKSHSDDAGFDLYSSTYTKVFPKERKLILTDIATIIPPGYYGQIFDRSGNAFKCGIHVLGGVIDSSYRGNIGVILYNTGEDVFNISYGDRIAQIIILPCPEFNVMEIDISKLNNTDRGAGGFGSTGK